MRLLAGVVMTAWIMFGLMTYCHRNDLQAIKQGMQDKQRLSLLDEIK